MNEELALNFSTPCASEYLTLGDYAESAYLDYAVSVVKSRALPYVADGQKPVQRRILYAMHEMRLVANERPVKSARIVGDVLGKYHPHGDTSAYEALVRLAQNFSMRYPLIDGQGNFGSRDGDGAAAMRYTEARLTPIAQLLLDEISEGTADFTPNYDGSLEEPRSLPARLPFVLLNGASGIAVGMATEIPPHNLCEVAQAVIELVGNPNLNHSVLMGRMLGPDFPGGGQIISSPAEIFAAYESGRGILKVRARYNFEKLAHRQWQLVITELPPGTSSQKVLEEIEELTNPKIRPGKKALTSEQLQTKQSLLVLLDAVRDESSKDSLVRLVFEPKSSRIDQIAFVNILLTYTSLESGMPINLVMIGTDGRPRQKGIGEILREWIGYRLETITRRTQFRLSRVQDRIHILEGRLTVFLSLNKVILMICELTDPKVELIAAFGLSQRQVDDILEIRLRQLAHLEKIKIEKCLGELHDERDRLEELLGSNVAMRRLIIGEIEADAKQFGDPRRTLIQPDKRAVTEALIVDEPVTVIVLRRGWARTMKGHGLDLSGLKLKDDDSLYAIFQCSTLDMLLALGSNGRMYSVPVSALPGGRSDGVPITSLIKLEVGTYLMHYFAAPQQQLLLLATNNGFGFIARIGDMISRIKTGKLFMSLDTDIKPLAPMPVWPNTSQVACLALGEKNKTRLLVFEVNEIKILSSGGRGLKLIRLYGNEQLHRVQVIGQDGLILSGVGRGKKQKQEILIGDTLASYVGKRAYRGKVPAVKFKVLDICSALGWKGKTC
ncbi:DNA topoisomerase IV subunit A [Candidatus Vallotia cooleyia]|uniref:DNA topoisomerase IV subunit A n=1 Tax=Candidatus Vallotiella adelgis TaxID=1177211 RepID=UPI001D02E21C|nr:DNA topoisomerase IV subunit A [Candidatus Vallotia cooleyia]UDG82414.1 DNA topoisomerase 4 subunit A [Candidatus Vallotia cooleyia]